MDEKVNCYIVFVDTVICVKTYKVTEIKLYNR